jgi:hypothetical protein
VASNEWVAGDRNILRYCERGWGPAGAAGLGGERSAGRNCAGGLCPELKIGAVPSQATFHFARAAAGPVISEVAGSGEAGRGFLGTAHNGFATVRQDERVLRPVAPCLRGLCASYQHHPSQGFRTGTPNGVKSLLLRMTRSRLRLRSVAARDSFAHCSGVPRS